MLIFFSLDTQEDREVFAEIYQANASRLLRYALSVLHSQADAEDAVQEVFLTLADKYERLKALPPEKIPGFLLVCTERKAIDLLRKRRDQLPLEECEELESRPLELPLESAAAGVLAELPAYYRELLLLRHGLGLSPREIAAGFGKSLSAIDSALFRAKRLFIRKYHEQEGTRHEP